MSEKSTPKKKRDTSSRPDGQQKKMLITYLLDVLRNSSDENHRLSQSEILKMLEEEYGLSVERKSVRRNLQDLVDLGYPIEYQTKERVTTVVDPATGEAEKRDSSIWYDIYLERDFTDSELRLLIDSLLFSRHIPNNQCRELVGKLEGLSGKYFRARIKHITTMPETQAQSPQLFSTIDILDEAIDLKKQVAFNYCKYGTDKKLHPQLKSDGAPREYVINPYQMAAKEGKYYLICNYDGKDRITNYRVDRITNVRMLDTPALPFEKVRGGPGEGLDLAKYMTEHVYMFSSENQRIDFRVKSTMISDVIDMFGTGVRFFDETEDEVSVSARVDTRSMKQFAMSFAPDVVILAPRSLAAEVMADLKAATGRYEEILKDEPEKKI